MSLADDLPVHNPKPNNILPSSLGIFTLSAKQVKNTEFREFEKAWYSQPSTAKISENGTRSDCSDAVDATGRYIWREDGKKEGRCCGIDFEEAGKKWRAGQECSSDDPVCSSAAISTYVPFAYDAGIAMAHGLHELVHRRGLRSDEIKADLLSQAIKNSTFEGVSGPVSFLSTGDRRVDDFEYVVYNYHETTRGFEVVGQMAGGSFTANCDPDACASLVFSDGTSDIPFPRVRAVSSYVPSSHTAFVSHFVDHGNVILSLGKNCLFDIHMVEFVSLVGVAHRRHFRTI